jgi:hypothetical protein
MHRGQFSTASHRALGLIVKPQRWQLSTVVPAISDVGS